MRPVLFSSTHSTPFRSLCSIVLCAFRTDKCFQNRVGCTCEDSLLIFTIMLCKKSKLHKLLVRLRPSGPSSAYRATEPSIRNAMVGQEVLYVPRRLKRNSLGGGQCPVIADGVRFMNFSQEDLRGYNSRVSWFVHQCHCLNPKSSMMTLTCIVPYTSI